MMSDRLIILSGGGTSGHVNPALAIADDLQQSDPALDLLFVGKKQGIEADLVKRAGYAFESVEAAPLPMRPSPAMIRAVATFLRGRHQSRQLMKKRRPLAVIGTGGYVCSPVVSAAASLKIPVLLHEQNAYPGRSNRLMARKSQAVCVAFPGTEHYFPFPDRVTVTGNPVRQAFFLQDHMAAREKLFPEDQRPLILAMGGSLGARTINEAICHLDAWISQRRNRDQSVPRIVLSAGKQHFSTVQSAVSTEGDWLTVIEYIHNMPEMMAAADLIISRAGALTCSEIAALGRPSVLVPYPYAAGDHQTFNARVLVDAGAALMCRDDQFDAAWLAENLNQLIDHPSVLKQMSERASSLAKPEATREIIRCLMRLTPL